MDIFGTILIFAIGLAFPAYLIIREIKKKKTLNHAVPTPYRDLKPEEIAWLQSRKPFFSQNFKKDLLEKVQRIEGPLFKEAVKSGASWTYIVTIGKVEFNLQEANNTEYEQLIQDIHQGQEISIQYSPSSKHIWNLDIIS
ncbi:MAG TPA: hypothetical protein VFG51_03950 [Candidatus Saccharimonadia bacterium]|nr:hypothetical protein [Candidatus Saccharimonadia bacterium]